MMENTYFIFASDNGGCYLGGGKNAPLRGNKATLLEGEKHHMYHEMNTLFNPNQTVKMLFSFKHHPPFLHSFFL